MISADESPSSRLQSPPLLIYGTAWKEERTTALVEQAILAGFRAIDTANQPKHYQEALVGEALRRLAARGIDRASLYLQTKFTPVGGQGRDIPYDPQAAIAEQVRRSFESSLKNLQTDYLDSYLLHGPYSSIGLGDEDWEVWRALESLRQTEAVRCIGISNVSAAQLETLLESAAYPPEVVQNRCYASRDWDLAVRTICFRHNIVYQGFSLLTANPEVLSHPRLQAIAARHRKTAAQIIYRFAIQSGMTPLTGTTSLEHMKEALTVEHFQLGAEEIEEIAALQ